MRDLVLQPAASLFGLVVSSRNMGFDLGYARTWKLERPVVSVGNLTVGGTGKTPTILTLLSELEKKGVKVGVISRGYKSGVTGVAEVRTDSETFYGDEPTLVKAKFPHVPFFIGPDRVAAGRALLSSYPAVELILADDAFQHRRLSRDLDIVLLDATRGRDHYRLLPAGYAREPMGSLSRADAIIITKTNIEGAYSKEVIQSWIESELGSLDGKLVLPSSVKLQTPKPIIGEELWCSQGIESCKLVSAIGNPEAFEKSVVDHLNLSVVDHVKLPDHFAYSQEKVRELIDSQSVWLTTEKDAIKLKQYLEPGQRVYSTELDFILEGEKERLIENICGLAN